LNFNSERLNQGIGARRFGAVKLLQLLLLFDGDPARLRECRLL